MKYLSLIKSCKKAIQEGRCLGCTALENPNFVGDINCEIHKNKEKICKNIGR